MSDAETDIGEAHACDILTQSHAFTAFFGVSDGVTQGFGNDFDGL